MGRDTGKEDSLEGARQETVGLQFCFQRQGKIQIDQRDRSQAKVKTSKVAALNPVKHAVRKNRRSTASPLDWLDDDSGDYDDWLKMSEEFAWVRVILVHCISSADDRFQKDGQRVAQERRVHLREIILNVRAEMREKQDAEAARNAEGIQELLRKMAIRDSKEEEDTARRFMEREKRLWTASGS